MTLFRKNEKYKYKVFFYRNYIRFRGSHLKIWHYFNHLKNTNDFEPYIYFPPNSVFDDSNPWKNVKKLDNWFPSEADILFLGGSDWKYILNNQNYLKRKADIPVISFIQGLNILKQENIKNAFLEEKAIRICVSPQVSEAIKATGQANGPVFTIQNGIDFNELPIPLAANQKDIDLLIVAVKNPELGNYLKQQLMLKVKSCCLVTDFLPRKQFLELTNRAKATIYLPMNLEGFYLTAIEGMFLETIVICPDCIGNSSFCIDGENCFFPTYDSSSILEATKQALALSSCERTEMLRKAKLTVSEHHIAHEAKQFLSIMKQIKEIW